MADTDAARIGDVKGGFAAARADAATRLKRDGSNVDMTTGQAAAFRAAIGAGGGGGGSGDVVGPAGATANALAVFADASGKLLKDGPMLGVASAGSVPTRADADARYQPLDPGLTALAGLSSVALYYLSAPDVWSPVTIGTNLTFAAGTLSAAGGGGGSGDVVGPASATADAPAVFSGTTGKLIKAGAFPVLSVAGLTGAITGAGLKTALALVKGDVGLGNVDNTTDAGKPVSTAQQAALDLKAALSDNIVVVSTTTHTVAASDLGKTLRFTNAAGCAVTLPNSFSAGFNFLWRHIGAGALTFAAQAGGTLNNRQNHTKSAGPKAEGSLAVDTNSGTNAAWWLSGDTAA